MSDDQSQKSVTILRLGRTRGRADRHSVLFGLNMRHFSGKLSPVDAAAEVIYPVRPNLGKRAQLSLPHSDRYVDPSYSSLCLKKRRFARQLCCRYNPSIPASGTD